MTIGEKKEDIKTECDVRSKKKCKCRDNVYIQILLLKFFLNTSINFHEKNISHNVYKCT